MDADPKIPRNLDQLRSRLNTMHEFVLLSDGRQSHGHSF